MTTDTTDPIAAARALLDKVPPLHIDKDGDLCRAGGGDNLVGCAASDDVAPFDYLNPVIWDAIPDLRDMVATLADALEAERAKVAAAYEVAAQWHEETVAHDQGGIDYSDAVGISISNRYELEQSVKAHTYSAYAIRNLTPTDAQAALDKLLTEARAMESMRADNLMRERNDALMRIGSLTEHLARLAEAKDHADGEPETDFDRGYDQAGDEIAAMIRDTEHNAQIILGEMLAEAREEGWRAGRDDAAEVAVSRYKAWSDEAWSDLDSFLVVCDVTACADVAAAIRAMPEPKEDSHD